MEAIYSARFTGASTIKARTVNTSQVQTIADRIRAFAAAKNGGKERGSLTAFAELIGMSVQQLNSYTSGGVEPKTDVLNRFREAGMSIDWLLSGEGEMFGESRPFYPSEVGNRGRIVGEVTLPSEMPLKGRIEVEGIEYEITGKRIERKSANN